MTNSALILIFAINLTISIAALIAARKQNRRPIVKFKKLHSTAQFPSYKTRGAACADVCALAEGVLAVGETRPIGTGLAMELPAGYELQVRSRSGLSVKGISVKNSPGTVDEDYRGEVQIILHNDGTSPFSYAAGDRIAQVKIARAIQAVFHEVSSLSETERGAGGLGSTGHR